MTPRLRVGPAESDNLLRLRPPPARGRMQHHKWMSNTTMAAWKISTISATLDSA